MAVIDHITTNNSATYEVQDTVARTKANNLESANYTDIGGGFADGNTFLVKTNDGMKKGYFNNFANWILDKLATKVYNQLATSNKTMIGALNELNSNTRFDVTVPDNVSIANNASIKVGRVVYLAVKLKITGALSSEEVLSFSSNAVNESTTFVIGKGMEWYIDGVIYGYLNRNSVLINSKNAVSIGDYLHISTVLIL